MQYIYSELDTALLDPSSGNLKEMFFYGTTDATPVGILPSFSQLKITPEMKEHGVTFTLTTNRSGEYEVVAYPATYGNTLNIDQNYVGINVLPGWTKEIIMYKQIQFIMYYTKMLHYSDNSTFVFKLNAI